MDSSRARQRLREPFSRQWMHCGEKGTNASSSLYQMVSQTALRLDLLVCEHTDISGNSDEGPEPLPGPDNS